MGLVGKIEFVACLELFTSALKRLPPVRITSLELLLSPNQLCRSACRRETLLGSGISENHSEPSLDCTVGGQSVPIQKI
ncbi:hypothetical protein TNCV_4063321 [Trichonephila clavipes]|nr:hypothetical protein TNCV_4063321 [Trichonephila clavipes]